MQSTAFSNPSAATLLVQLPQAPPSPLLSSLPTLCLVCDILSSRLAGHGGAEGTHDVILGIVDDAAHKCSADLGKSTHLEGGGGGQYKTREKGGCFRSEPRKGRGGERGTAVQPDVADLESCTPHLDAKAALGSGSTLDPDLPWIRIPPRNTPQSPGCRSCTCPGQAGCGAAPRHLLRKRGGVLREMNRRVCRLLRKCPSPKLRPYACSLSPAQRTTSLTSAMLPGSTLGSRALRSMPSRKGQTCRRGGSCSCQAVTSKYNPQSQITLSPSITLSPYITTLSLPYQSATHPPSLHHIPAPTSASPFHYSHTLSPPHPHCLPAYPLPQRDSHLRESAEHVVPLRQYTFQQLQQEGARGRRGAAHPQTPTVHTAASHNSHHAAPARVVHHRGGSSEEAAPSSYSPSGGHPHAGATRKGRRRRG